MGQLLPDDVSVRRWFAFYGLLLLGAGVPLAEPGIPGRWRALW